MIRADLVRAHREKLGLTQSELAAKMGLTQQAISAMEAGKVGYISRLYTLADHLKVDAGDLLLTRAERRKKRRA